MFQVAACVSCHRLNGVGEALGPDLAKLDPKTTPLDTLKNVLDPSLKIDDKFRTYLFEMNVGQGRHGDDPRRDGRRGQGDREPARVVGAGGPPQVGDRATARSRPPRSCPRACSTS